MKTNKSLLMAGMYANAFKYTNSRYSNSLNPDKRIISPPQSEESKQYHLKKAEEKRLRKMSKRRLGNEKNKI